MPQAIWTGAISFGLVSVPVRLYPATRRKDVRFHELDRATGRRIRHQRIRDEAPFQLERPSLEPPSFELPSVEPSPGPRVAYEDVVKGFEVAPRQYVAVSREELEAIAPERSRTIDIEQFVDAAAIDPIAFQTSYYVVPDRDVALDRQQLAVPPHARRAGRDRLARDEALEGLVVVIDLEGTEAELTDVNGSCAVGAAAFAALQALQLLHGLSIGRGFEPRYRAAPTAIAQAVNM